LVWLAVLELEWVCELQMETELGSAWQRASPSVWPLVLE
jgi:hypothetical protein